MTIVAIGLASPAFAQAGGAAQPQPAPPAAEQTVGAAGPQASSAPDSSGGVQDIVVTAQFRGQRQQDTPIAITALGSLQLEQRGFTRITDITDSAPNVVLKPSSATYGPAATIFIRGVGQQDSSFAQEPGVGVYIDDVYRGITFGSVLDLLDLDRVEILRGPQGTLAGKNSIGGAVKLFTRKPDGDTNGYVQVTTGDYDRIDAKAAANITLMPDKLFARVSAVTRHQEGYLKRLDYNCANPTGPRATTSVASDDCVIGHDGGQNYTAGRLALRWLATDDIEVNLAGDRLVDNSTPPASKLIALTGSTAPIPQSAFITGPRAYTSYANYSVQSFTDPAAFLARPGAGTHPPMSFPDHNRIRAWDASGTIDWRINDLFQVKSITGYQYTNGRYSVDNDLTPFGLSGGVFGMRFRQFTQELRLNASFFDGKVDSTVGGYYYSGKGYLTGINVVNPGLPSETVNTVNDYIPSTSKSVFAQAIWHVADGLNLTGGIRYTDDRKSYSFTRGNVYVPGIPTYTGAALINGVTSVYKGDRVDYRAVVDYKVLDNVLVYAQYSTGYRGGGVNPRPFVIQQAVPFAPETLDAYEVGIKSDLLDRKLRVNVSAFINNYHDIVFTNTAPTVVNGVVVSAANGTPTNAGNGRFKGVELEVTARPFGGFSVDATASYLDFNLTKIGANGVTIAGVTLNNIAPYVTKWKASAGAQYAFATSIGTFTPRVDMAYQSSFFTNVNNVRGSYTPKYTIFNGHITWDSPERTWQTTLAVSNMFDKLFYLNKFVGPAIGVSNGQPGGPRQFSLSLRRNF